MKLMKCTAEQEKDTGLALVLIFLIIEFLKKFDVEKFPLVLRYIVKPFVGLEYLLLIPLILLLLTMTFPRFFKPVAPLWFGFSLIIGGIVSKVLLTLVFLIVVSPVGLLRRLIGIDSMGIKKWKQGADSVFVKRDHTYAAADLEIPY